MSWSHRPALDGLRTIAVYLVVLFHAGVSAFSGGFIGVDLFFVLSGFLVTSVLLDQVQATGTIRLGRFYARRVRRLLPAAVIVIIATSALFMILTTVPARVPWVADARSALLYVANWRFISSDTDYFGPDIDASPFLHFWSLAIEEQFYLVLPVLLLGLFKLRKRWAPAIGTVLAALLALGVIAQLVWAQVNPTWAYYGTDARIYQLLLGTMAAWLWHSRIAVHYGTQVRRADDPLTGGDRLRALVGWAAVVTLVVAATGWWDPTASVRGLLAALASVVLIWAVTDEWSLSLNWVLSRTTITYLGKISYGTYLWHWPVLLAFREMLEAEAWALFALTAATSTGLAALSARLVEMPIRRPSFLDRAPAATIAAGLTVSVVSAVAFAPWLLQAATTPQLPAPTVLAPQVETEPDDRTPVPQGIDWEKYVYDNGMDVSTCLEGERLDCYVHRASVASAATRPHVLLVGDSHAQMMAGVFTRFAREQNFTLSTAIIPHCSWQWGLKATNEGYPPVACPTNREELYTSRIKEQGVDVVVLAQRERVENDEWHGLVSAEGVEGDIDDANVVTVNRTLDRLQQLGVKVVVMKTALQPVMAGQTEPLDCLARAEFAEQCAVTAPRTEPFVDSLYRVAVKQHTNQTMVDINPVMCPSWPTCSPLVGRVPLWHDDKHMSSTALLARSDELWKVFAATGMFGTS